MVYLDLLAKRPRRTPTPAPHTGSPPALVPVAPRPAMAGRRLAATPSAAGVVATVILVAVGIALAVALLAAVPPAAVAPLVTMVVTVATVAVAFLALERLTRGAHAARRRASQRVRGRTPARARRCPC